MSRVLRILLLTILIILALLLLAGAYFRFLLIPRSFPQTQGEIKLVGLENPVTVYRDAYGVPQIYAEDEHDLFMAQGYIHAQDRFWQMDFWRHIGSGRLSELVGESQVETDKFLRTMGWARVVEQELAIMDKAQLAVLQAYAEGVNAYLRTHQGGEISLEYALLPLINREYVPEPWTPLHSLTWAKVMAFDLSGNMEEELRRVVLEKTWGEERAAELYPPYPEDHPVIVSSGELELGQETAKRSPRPSNLLSLEQAQALREPLIALRPILGSNTPDIGSNNWVISGERTTTGMPLLADDMHLGIQMPSIWYENGLHCQPISDKCRFNVVGYSFAGLPGVVVGHNDHIAWGVTNVGPDVQDLYLERLNPDNPNQYEVNGEWVDMELRAETIRVAGGPSVNLIIRSTRHGPIVSDYIDRFEALADQSRPEGEGPMAVSLRWTALEPNTIIQSALEIDLATDWESFRTALQKWDVPSQNFVYADVEGNIGYQTPGNIPIRANGDGTIPVPGWTDEYEWTGYIPFEELPQSFNPEKGYIATANNAVVTPDYPHLISLFWDYGYRANRIVELIEAKERLSIQDLQDIHGDNFIAIAPVLIPHLQRLEYEDPEVEEGVDMLRGWNWQNDMDSAPAALFNVIWRNLLVRTFSDELAKGDVSSSSYGFVLTTQLLKEPHSLWWDDIDTRILESRDDILLAAVEDAVVEIEGLLGEDSTQWAWGDLHTATFRNGVFGESGIKPLEALFNRGPVPASGGSSIVNATGWSAEGGYEVGGLPSQRMIVDLSDLSNSLSVHTTGQSGHAFHPHYDDMIDMWRHIQYHPMLWSREQIEALAEETLQLIP